MKKWIGYDIDRLSPSTTGLNYSVLVVANRYFDMPIIKVLVEGDNGQKAILCRLSSGLR